MSKQKKKRQGERTPKQTSVVLVEYEITNEPIKKRNYRKLPAPVRTRIEELHNLIYRRPSQSIATVEELLEKYPHVPMLYNYLSVAYSGVGETEKAEALTKRNYEQNPDYLFAKCNYAEVCLNKGEPEKIPIIFDNKFDLKLLYPRRKKFHISEVVAFAGIMGGYFSAIGEKPTAEFYYDLIRRLAPRHPVTRRLKRILRQSIIRRILGS